MPNKFFLILLLGICILLPSCSREDSTFQPPSQYGELYVHGYYQMIGPESRTVAIWVQRDQFVLCDWGTKYAPHGKTFTGYFDAKTASFYFAEMPAVVMQAAGYENAWSLLLTNDDTTIGDFRKVGTWGEAVEYAPQGSVCKQSPAL